MDVLPSINIDLTKPNFVELRKIWEDDYYSICRQLKNHIETSADGYIHTSNGKHIQVRSKDSNHIIRYTQVCMEEMFQIRIMLLFPEAVCT